MVDDARIIGYRHLAKLVIAIERHAARSTLPSSTPRHAHRAPQAVTVKPWRPPSRFHDDPGILGSRVEQLVAGIDAAGGPPPDVPSTGVRLLFDEAQVTAVVLQPFDTADDMRKGDEAFGAMDPAETPRERASVDMRELRLDRRASD